MLSKFLFTCLRLFMAAGLTACMWYAMWVGLYLWGPVADILVVLLLVYASITFCTLFHELGHVMAAQMNGARFLWMIIGPLKITGTPRGPRMALSRRSFFQGGVTASIPGPEGYTKGKMIWYAAAGSLVNILMGLFTAVLCFSLEYISPAAYVALSLFCVTSTWSGVQSLIPAKVKGFETDGAHILALLRNDRNVILYQKILALQNLLISGTRPRDLPAGQLVEVLKAAQQEVVEPGVRASAWWFGYFYELDHGRVGNAGKFLDGLLVQRDQLPPSIRQPMFLEAAYFTAIHRGNAEHARLWLEQAKGSFSDPAAEQRARAAVLLAEGKPAEARLAAEKSLALSKLSIDAGGVQAEREWAQAILAVADLATTQGQASLV